MRATTRRLIIAILAWPTGLVAAVVWLFISSPTPSCPPGSACAVQLQPVSIEHTVKLAAILLGPGVIATMMWWRGRHDPDASQETLG